MAGNGSDAVKSFFCAMAEARIPQVETEIKLSERGQGNTATDDLLHFVLGEVHSLRAELERVVGRRAAALEEARAAIATLEAENAALRAAQAPMPSSPASPRHLPARAMRGGEPKIGLIVRGQP